jgi:hypothetical protein
LGGEVRFLTFRQVIVLAGMVLALSVPAAAIDNASAEVNETSSQWINRIVTQGPSKIDPATTVWNIVMTPRGLAEATPGHGLRDFASIYEPSLVNIAASTNPVANVSPEAPLWDGEVFLNAEGDPLAPFWTAVVPATLTLTFDPGFVLERADLASYSRKAGFSDFAVLVRDATAVPFAAPRLLEATAEIENSTAQRFLWTLLFDPVPVRQVCIVLKQATAYIRNQVFLHDLDLWGKARE